MTPVSSSVIEGPPTKQVANQAKRPTHRRHWNSPRASLTKFGGEGLFTRCVKKGTIEIKVSRDGGCHVSWVNNTIHECAPIGGEKITLFQVLEHSQVHHTLFVQQYDLATIPSNH
jgi:hypothetical protein